MSSHVATFSCGLPSPLRDTSAVSGLLCLRLFWVYLLTLYTISHSINLFCQLFLEVKFAVSVLDGSKKIRRGSLNAAQKEVIFPSGWNSEGKRAWKSIIPPKKTLETTILLWYLKLTATVRHTSSCDRRRGKPYRSGGSVRADWCIYTLNLVVKYVSVWTQTLHLNWDLCEGFMDNVSHQCQSGSAASGLSVCAGRNYMSSCSMIYDRK